MSAYHVGDQIEYTLTIKDHTGTLVDPTTVQAAIRDPNYEETTATPSKTGVGIYVGSFEATAAGPWVVSAKCSGGYKGCEPQTIQVFGAFG